MKKQYAISKFFTPSRNAHNLPVPLKSDLHEYAAKSGAGTIARSGNKDESATAKRSAAAKDADSGRAKSKDAPRKLTPLEKQIIELNADNSDKILAIQVGYKYKFFGEDAAIVSKILNIMLIRHTDARFNYCSIPDNRLHIHLKRLLEYGLKVGVVKQTETAVAKQVESSKGLFDRRLTGIYTKATYLNEESEKDEINEVGDYIVAVYETASVTALVGIRAMSGEIVVDSFTDTVLKEGLETRLTYLKPNEVIALGSRLKTLMAGINNKCHIIESEPCTIDEALASLGSFFSSELYDYYRLNFGAEIVICIDQLIKYLKQFNLSSIFTATSKIVHYNDSKTHMILSANVLRSLEIFENTTDGSSKGTLFYFLNHTSTKMGERLLRRWVSKPLVTKTSIVDRHNAVADLKKEFNHCVDSLKTLITKCSLDLEKLLMKIHYSCDGIVSKVNRKEVYLMLRFFNDVVNLVKSFSNEIAKIDQKFQSVALKSIFKDILALGEALDIENEYLRLISANYALDDKNPLEQKLHYFNLNVHDWEILSKSFDAIDEVNEEIAMELKHVRKILNKPNLTLVKNLNNDNLIEVRNSIKDKVPLDWIKISSTKTVTRFRSPELERLNKQLLYHNEMLVKNSDIVFKEFLYKINDKFESFSGITSNIAKFDCLLSLAAASYNGEQPEIVDNKQIRLKNFRNPIVESLIKGAYITNDVSLSETHNRISVITGPNMGGKSTYIKSIGIVTILNQIGCFLPCDEASVGIFSSILLRMGSSDNILRGKSTFMIEMLECEHIINSYDTNSLILLDEVGRGTGTDDGLAIAYGILRYFCESPMTPIILFITHYPSLGKLADTFADVATFHMDYKEDKDNIIFLYKVVKGIVANAYGLNVARLSGIPEQIINNAELKSEALKQEMALKAIAQTTSDIKKGNFKNVFRNI